MGLDLYLYRVLKPSHSDNTSYVPVGEVERLCDTITNIAEVIFHPIEYYNMEKVAQDFGMDKETLYVSCMSSEGIAFRDDKTCTPDIPYDEIEAKYINTVNEQVYAFDFDEIDYQRKGLDDLGWSRLPENCSYTDDVNVIIPIVEGGLSQSFIDNWIEGETVFHPWW